MKTTTKSVNKTGETRARTHDLTLRKNNLLCISHRPQLESLKKTLLGQHQITHHQLIDANASLTDPPASPATCSTSVRTPMTERPDLFGSPSDRRTLSDDSGNALDTGDRGQPGNTEGCRDDRGRGAGIALSKSSAIWYFRRLIIHEGRGGFRHKPKRSSPKD
jgi:hypothetical protein